VSLRYDTLVGVGGIGAGILFTLEGDRDLGRNESRPARLEDARDYCKLHIIAHYPARLAGPRGLRVIPVGKVGADDVGRRLEQEMAAAGMDTRFLKKSAAAPTLFSVCFQYPDGSGGNITSSSSAASRLKPSDLDRVAAVLGPTTIALAAPEVPLETRVRLLEIATERGAYRVATFTPTEIATDAVRAVLDHVDLLAINEDEAVALGRIPLDGADPAGLLEACGQAFMAANPQGQLIVTLGVQGAHAFSDCHWTHVPAAHVPVRSTSGAGDALLGGVLTALALGLPFVPDALELGTLLAAFKVTSPHTIPPEIDRPLLQSFAAVREIPLSPSLTRFLSES
jgi:sugar/nucleoside kinase (ribokinase family)